MTSRATADSALCWCSKGCLPSLLIARSASTLQLGGKIAATVQDVTFASPFGVCLVTQSICSHAPAGPWSDITLSVFIGGVPILSSSAEHICTKGGVIKIVEPATVALLLGERLAQLTAFLGLPLLLNLLEKSGSFFGGKCSLPTDVVVPPGASVDDNIRSMELAWWERYNTFHTNKLMDWLNRVREDGDWDYKTQGAQYEAFGNFNYGATGAALKIPEQVLLRGAGAVQKLVGTPGEGKPWGGAPYGDDSRDQSWIKQGVQYYRDNCAD